MQQAAKNYSASMFGHRGIALPGPTGSDGGRGPEHEDQQEEAEEKPEHALAASGAVS